LNSRYTTGGFCSTSLSAVPSQLMVMQALPAHHLGEVVQPARSPADEHARILALDHHIIHLARHRQACLVQHIRRDIDIVLFDVIAQWSS
jgi:hypothetical protein